MELCAEREGRFQDYFSRLSSSVGESAAQKTAQGKMYEIIAQLLQIKKRHGKWRTTKPKRNFEQRTRGSRATPRVAATQ